MVRRIEKGLLAVVALLTLIAVPFISYQARAQNNTPTYPSQFGATNFPSGVINGCSNTGTLSSGVLNQTLACMKNGGFTTCLAAATGASAQNYAGIGIGCAATTTATATSTATATATTATYGGTTIATATATSTATSTAIGGVALTASTLNASPAVVWWGVR